MGGGQAQWIDLHVHDDGHRRHVRRNRTREHAHRKEGERRKTRPARGVDRKENGRRGQEPRRNDAQTTRRAFGGF